MRVCKTYILSSGHGYIKNINDHMENPNIKSAAQCGTNIRLRASTVRPAACICICFEDIRNIRTTLVVFQVLAHLLQQITYTLHYSHFINHSAVFQHSEFIFFCHARNPLALHAHERDKPKGTHLWKHSTNRGQKLHRESLISLNYKKTISRLLKLTLIFSHSEH